MDLEIDDIESKLKRAVIAGASEALKFKNENPRASDEEAMQTVTSDVDAILSRID